MKWDAKKKKGENNETTQQILRTFSKYKDDLKLHNERACYAL